LNLVSCWSCTSRLRSTALPMETPQGSSNSNFPSSLRASQKPQAEKEPSPFLPTIETQELFCVLLLPLYTGPGGDWTLKSYFITPIYSNQG
jgi:hypothetical protein